MSMRARTRSRVMLTTLSSLSSFLAITMLLLSSARLVITIPLEMSVIAPLTYVRLSMSARNSLSVFLLMKREVLAVTKMSYVPCGTDTRSAS